MGRRNAKKAKPQVVAANDPTPERMRRGSWNTTDAPRMAGERAGPNDKVAAIGKVPTQVPPLMLWYRAKWIDDAQFVALHNYDRLVESCGFERSRSCLDWSPKGEGGLPPAVLDARSRRAAVSFAARCYCDSRAWSYVEAILMPYGAEVEADVVERMLPGMGRDRQRDTRREWVSLAAAALLQISA